MKYGCFALSVVGLLSGVMEAAAATWVVTNSASSGPGSLRQAILDANAAAPSLANRIEFQLSGPGPYRLQPDSPLPDVRGPIVIDGFTQPGFSGRPLVELRGDRAGAADGLRLVSLCQVQGLVINRFSQTGIRCLGGTNVIRGNFIGTDVSGKASLGNGEAAVDLFLGPGGNVIGGPTSLDRNILSGNRWGIYLLSPGNRIQGNYVGVDVDGVAAVANGTGLLLIRSSRNSVGGAQPGEGNVVSGNVGAGIELAGSALDGPLQNILQGNIVGLNASGRAAVGNSGPGLLLGLNAQANVIGGTTEGAGNLIGGNLGPGVAFRSSGPENQLLGNRIGLDRTATNGVPNGGAGVEVNASGQILGRPDSGAGNVVAFNALAGVAVLEGTNNRISGNRIFSNGRAGIQLGTEETAVNDVGDLDEGPNHKQNAPEFTSARLLGSQIFIEGSLRSAANTPFDLEFFASPQCGPSGSGEGFVNLGGSQATTTATGTAPLAVVLSNDLVRAGWQITATATDPNGNTSWFSLCAPLTEQARVIPVFVDQPLNQSEVPGGSITFSATITGEPPPFEFELRRGTTPLATNFTTSRAVFFTLTNLQTIDGAVYRILARNAATTGAGIPSRNVVLTILPDTDGDGLPDAWESAHALGPGNPGDAGLDTDGDGMSNLDEYRADTDPRDRSDVLRLAITKVDGALDKSWEVSFNAVSNKTYTVQASENSRGGPWLPVVHWAARATNTTVRITNSVAGEVSRYFRLVTPAQP